MVGIVLVTHRNLAAELIDTAEFILEERPENVVAVSIDIKEKADLLRAKIAAAIKMVNRNHGVIIMTDMFGGTPSNLSYSFLDEGQVEVISGVNLPILIKAVNCRKRHADDLAALAETLAAFGKKSISLASDILKGNKRN